MAIHFNGQKVKIPFRLKVTLGLSLVLALVLLFFFGITFFFIALAGGLLSLLAGLFGVKRQSGVNIQFTNQADFRPRSGPRSRPRQRIQDDDVIDI